MGAPQKPVTSPDLSILSFSVAYDISGAAPTLTLTNLSTVTNPNALTWWYTVKSPSGTDIHAGNQTSPDVNHAPWTTLDLPANSWPLIFGLNPPCAQIEFSDASPYVCTLYVADSASNIFSLAIGTLITRPNGNDSNSCGNFGKAAVAVTVYCNTNKILCTETTNVAYQNVLVPTVDSSKWTLTYPADVNGNVPSPATAQNTPNVYFPTGFSGNGYTVFLNHYATYDMGNGSSVKVQYKAINPDSGGAGIPFAVLCNIDLCKLQCQLNTFYKQTKEKCGNVVDPATSSKMIRMNLLFGQVLMGILQPLCGIDVPAIIKEIKKVGDLDENCDCGCKDGGNNFFYPLGPAQAGGGCCPSSSNVLDIATDNPPAPCPNSYFPAKVYDPTGATVIGTATDIGSLVAILNSNSAWAAFGTAFPEGNCKIGWFTVNPATTVPPVKVGITSTGNLVKKGTTQPPTGCPSGNPYPLKVYDPTGTTVIGIANSITDVVNILNGNSAWQAYGVASTKDSCHVSWSLTDPNVQPPSVQTDPGSTIGNLVQVGTTTPPTGCPTGNPYPLRIYNPAGDTVIGIAYSINDVVSILNANSAWAAFGTASPNGNCQVSWNLNSPSNVPPPIGTDTNTGGTGGTGCTNGTNIAVVDVVDLCYDTQALTLGDFPMNLWVDWLLGGGPVYLGIATSAADMISKLNAASGKPASISFSLASSGDPSQVQVTNTNCIAYNHVPTITSDLGSASFILFGSSHSNFVPIASSAATVSGEYAAGLHNYSSLGKIPPGMPVDGRGWSTMLMGNTLAATDSKNGVIYYWDVTNPLTPIFIRTITLTCPSGATGCFTATPSMNGIVPAAQSYFCLYFPTNSNAQMTVNNHFVVETKSGSIWRLDIAAGVVESLYDQRLIGKCPRMIVNRLGDEPNLYFTQDGDLESSSGLSSGVAPGDVVRMQTTGAFSSGNVHVINGVISGASEEVWCADTDGINSIYFVGKLGAVSIYNFITDTVTNRYTGQLGVYSIKIRGFCLYRNSQLYITSLGSFNAGTAQGTGFLQVASLGVSPLFTLFVGTSAYPNPIPGMKPYSIISLGNCLMAVVGDGYNNSMPGFTNGGGIVLYKSDGTLMGMIQLPANVNIANIVAIPNLSVYTPNSFV